MQQDPANQARRKSLTDGLYKLDPNWDKRKTEYQIDPIPYGEAIKSNKHSPYDQ